MSDNLTYPSLWGMRDNHTFTPIKGDTIVELINAIEEFFGEDSSHCLVGTDGKVPPDTQPTLKRNDAVSRDVIAAWLTSIASGTDYDKEDKNNVIDRLKKWVDDLQSGVYVNCVYCGHRYGPKETTPVSMADALTEHIETCPEHPMAKLKQDLERYRTAVNTIYGWSKEGEYTPDKERVALILANLLEGSQPPTGPGGEG